MSRESEEAMFVFSNSQKLTMNEFIIHAERIQRLIEAKLSEPTAGVSLEYESDALTNAMSAIYALNNMSIPILMVNPKLPRPYIESLCTRNNIFYHIYVQHDTVSISLRAEPTPTTRLPGQIIVLTSGTESQPKGVVIGAKQINFSVRNTNQALGLHNKSRWLLSLPLFHVSGLMIFYRALIGQYTIVISDSKSETLSLEHSVTHLSLVPSQLRELIENNTSFPKTLQAILIGGAGRSASLDTLFKNSGLPIWYSYGSTETCSHISLGNVSSSCNQNYAGKVLPGIKVNQSSSGKIQIHYQAGKASHYLTESGLIEIPNPLLMNDNGYLNEKNELFITGRADSVINSGGEKIYPSLIENIVKHTCMVKDCIVLGFSHPRWGQRPVLFYERSTELTKTEVSTLTSVIETQLGKIFIPDLFLHTPTFPRSALDKISHLQLRNTFKDLISDFFTEEKRE